MNLKKYLIKKALNYEQLLLIFAFSFCVVPFTNCFEDLSETNIIYMYIFFNIDVQTKYITISK